MRRILAVLLAGAFLSGCSSPSPIEIITSASDLARDKGSAKMVMVFAGSTSFNGRPFESKSTGEGAFEFATRKGKFTMRVEVPSAPGNTTQTLEVASEGTVSYFKCPAAQEPPHWIKLDIAKLGGVDANSFSSDPTISLDYLKSVDESVEVVGEEEIRGTPTTHYRFTVSVDRLLEKVKSEFRDRQRATFEQMGLTDIPMDVWIADDGLPRRIAFKMSPTGGSADSPKVKLEMTMEMFDYGTPVDVQLPEASDVRELSDTQDTSSLVQCFGGPAAPTGTPTGS